MKKSNVTSPFVRCFVETVPEPQKMLEAIGKIPGPRNAKEAAIIANFEASLGSTPLEDARRLIEAALEQGSDPDLHIVLVVGILRFSLQGHRLQNDEVLLLLRRAKSMVSTGTPAVLKAWLGFFEGEILARRGNLAEGLKKIAEGRNLCPPDSPHRPFLEFARALRLWGLGMGAVLPKQVWAGAHANKTYKAWVELGSFINEVLVGEQDSALSRLPDMERLLTNDPRSPIKGSAEEAFRLVRLMQWDKENRGALHAFRKEEMEGPEHPPWVISSRYLLRGQANEALRWARIYAVQIPASDLPSLSFNDYTLIRAELASGHPEAARGLLTRQRDRGTQHYLDDFFLARVEQQLGHESAAAGHIGALLKSVETYGAEGRLDFEIRLATELNPRDLLRWGKLPPAPVSASIKEPRPAPAEGNYALISKSSLMDALREIILKLAPLPAPVLITGETGTGKELVARALHDSGSRAKHPFIAVNCGAVSEALIESELFGHLRGAFTGADQPRRGLFQEAGQGSIFLDEVGDVSPKLQVSLLRVLELGEFRPVGGTNTQQMQCRVITATNADLERRVEDGTFRKDLFFRLKRLEVHIPPLRERPEDIPVLAAAFLEQGRPAGAQAAMSKALLSALSAHSWPGNVRELKNVIERMRLLNSDKLSYDVEDLTPTVMGRGLVEEREAPAVEVKSAPPPVLEPAGLFIEAGRREGKMLREILALFGKYKRMRAYQVTEMIGVTPTTTTRYLRALCEAGLVQKMEPSSSPRSHYFVLKEP